ALVLTSSVKDFTDWPDGRMHPNSTDGTRSEARGQRSEVRGRKSEVGGQREVRSQRCFYHPLPKFWHRVRMKPCSLAIATIAAGNTPSPDCPAGRRVAISAGRT